MALLAGAFGIAGPSSASAEKLRTTASPNYTCQQAMDISIGLRKVAQTMENIGNKELAAYYDGKAEGIADAYYPCGNWGGGKGK
jgi:hypothetical protein